MIVPPGNFVYKVRTNQFRDAYVSAEWTGLTWVGWTSWCLCPWSYWSGPSCTDGVNRARWLAQQLSKYVNRLLPMFASAKKHLFSDYRSVVILISLEIRFSADQKRLVIKLHRSRHRKLFGFAHGKRAYFIWPWSQHEYHVRTRPVKTTKYYTRIQTNLDAQISLSQTFMVRSHCNNVAHVE